MKIQKLQLHNFRGFKDLEITFPENNLAVFIGINGAGKSSILDAIAILLTPLVAKLCNESLFRAGMVLAEDDYNTESDVVTLVIYVEGKQGLLKAGLDVRRSQINRVKPDRSYADFSDFWYFQLEENFRASLPILLYYPTSRLVQLPNNTSKKPKKYRYAQLYAFENSFSKNVVEFDDFINWFRAEEDLENQIISRDDPGYQNRNLDTVRTAIETFFGCLNSSTVYSDLRVVRSHRDNDFSFRPSIVSSLEINKQDGKKDSERLKIEQLSDGEKNLLLIVSDIARRLAIANPGFDRADTILSEGEGIILIDEIDAHLHPQWQREVMTALQRTFQNCQFIVTTHSPQVLSNVKQENIFILENRKLVENNPHSYGRDTNSILYEFMGVEKRPEWMQKKIDDCLRLIDNDQVDAAKTTLQELQKSLGQHDPDIVRANTMLHFLYDS